MYLLFTTCPVYDMSKSSTHKVRHSLSNWTNSWKRARSEQYPRLNRTRSGNEPLDTDYNPDVAQGTGCVRQLLGQRFGPVRILLGAHVRMLAAGGSIGDFGADEFR